MWIDTAGQVQNLRSLKGEGLSLGMKQCQIGSQTKTPPVNPQSSGTVEKRSFLQIQAASVPCALYARQNFIQGVKATGKSTAAAACSKSERGSDSQSGRQKTNPYIRLAKFAHAQNHNSICEFHIQKIRRAKARALNPFFPLSCGIRQSLTGENSMSAPERLLWSMEPPDHHA